MKLNSLYIEDYKILKDFRIEFRKDVSILIGINGSGKSTIIEAIAQIFSDVLLNQRTNFNFVLNYTYFQINNKIQIEHSGIIPPPLTIVLTGEINEIPKLQVLFGVDQYVSIPSWSTVDDFIPRIVLYYSGFSEIIKSICAPHDKVLSKQFREGITNAKRPFIFFEPPLFDLILISLLSYEYGDVPIFLSEKAKINGVQSIRIRLKKPSWAKQKIDKWWGAKGEVKSFLDLLNSKMNNINLVDSLLTKDFTRKGNVIMEAFADEYLIITIIGQEKLFEIREHFVEEKKLFEILNTLYIDDLWVDCAFSFTNTEHGKTSSFSLLSEGEQQAITIKGLTELVTTDNTLFLLDEPDTYLHPSWQRNFIEGIINYTESSSDVMSQFLITTHSPQLLSNADSDKSEVQIIEEGEIVKITPKYYGRDTSTILYELMGVERRNNKVAKELSNLFLLIDDEELEPAKLVYQQLSDLLGVDDPAIIRAKTQLDYLEEANNEAHN